MRRLTSDELKGIDSTSKTIAKWDEFFKKALWNLGYKQSLIDNMYPYSKGIPMIDGSYMPVSKETGRVFFKMSLADKLCQVMSVFYQTESRIQVACMACLMDHIWKSSFEMFSTFFKDATEEDYTEYKDEWDNTVGARYDSSENYEFREDYQDKHRRPVFARYWKKFIENSTISQNGLTSHVHNDDAGNIDNRTKALLSELELSTLSTEYSGMVPVIYCHLVEDDYCAFPKDAVAQAFNVINSFNSSAVSRYRYFSEVYLQDYLVISLNPIDKFMCSTKQAFSSCMSIAKQNDVYGTSSSPAFGLPSIFESDSVFLTFMTPGKHKNMYWEESEWEKDAPDRDKEKAYKYLKMTCRALTYKGQLLKSIRTFLKKVDERATSDDFEDIPQDVKDKLVGDIKELNPEGERLFVGRQYSANGEDFAWQQTIELIMARYGIATGMAYATSTDQFMDDLQRAIDHDPNIANGSAGFADSNRYKYLRCGSLCDHKVAVFDRFGYIRGIYYDNISLAFDPAVQGLRGNGYPDKKSLALEYPVLPTDVAETVIQVGSSRSGSGGVTWFPMKSGVDMFKVMLGKQGYSYLNTRLKICDDCGEVIEGELVLCHDSTLCKACAEKKQIIVCEHCGQAYSALDKEDAAMHEAYNIMELIHPKSFEKYPPKYLCKATLKILADENNDSFVCPHCGDTFNLPSDSSGYIFRDSRRKRAMIHRKFHGYNIRIDFCNSCLDKAVMCDKCHRVLFLEDTSDACLLLPNRRVICPDCVDKIRLKVEKRRSYQELLRGLEEDDLTEDSDYSAEPMDELASSIKEEGCRIGRSETMIKDVRKQIASYKQAHPEVDLPEQRETQPPVVEVAEETIGA